MGLWSLNSIVVEWSRNITEKLLDHLKQNHNDTSFFYHNDFGLEITLHKMWCITHTC